MHNLQILPESYANPNLPNLCAVLEDCYGEIDYLNELVSLFRESLAEFIETTSKHIQKFNYRGVFEASHKVKVGLELMKAFGLHELVIQMERLSHAQENMGQIIRLFNLFVSEYPYVLHSIDAQQHNLLAPRVA